MKQHVKKKNHDPKEGTGLELDDSELQLDKPALKARLELVYMTVKRKREDEIEGYENRLKEYKTNSVMTKYQMIFTKIEVYIARLVNILYLREKRLKLLSFLNMKIYTKLQPLKIDVFARATLYRLAKVTSSLEVSLCRIRTKLMIKSFICIKFTSLSAQSQQIIHNNSGKKKINLMKLFNKKGSKKCVINQFDDCLRESDIELGSDAKLLTDVT